MFPKKEKRSSTKVAFCSLLRIFMHDLKLLSTFAKYKTTQVALLYNKNTSVKVEMVKKKLKNTRFRKKY